ncbi:uncharacterized protein CTRU02_204280 [Colletotrichum truncatum]|uniref:Uncharacterized protein n=1 Tax=Colletotrichum truncatum TaxID=5467 RepID=A0ACC3ZBM2_COLTU|nr:uncharacterized protein CTRU02_10132 [Colletotrichum truncatum]KAF6787837.1 hypothetical protein CTRU02_10132 [Colletotrichum truncatum]
MLRFFTHVLLGATAIVFAATPPGFRPSTDKSLAVAYGNISALNGVDLPQALTRNEPIFGTTEPLVGTSFTIIMVDIDIPTENPPATDTYLHWFRTGFVQDSSPTLLSLNNGSAYSIYQFRSNHGDQAHYVSPAPPAKTPLRHRYVEILVDTSNISGEAATIMGGVASLNRKGVNVEGILTQAGLIDKVVAGNWFTITNPGPEENS